MDHEEPKPQSQSTVISTVLLIDDTYIDQWVQTCGKEVTKSCAEDVFASIDANISKLLEAAAK